MTKKESLVFLLAIPATIVLGFTFLVFWMVLLYASASLSLMLILVVALISSGVMCWKEAFKNVSTKKYTRRPFWMHSEPHWEYVKGTAKRCKERLQ